MSSWAILFVKTGSEETLTRNLKAKLNAGEYLPFLPIRETAHRSRGVISKKRKLLFPGYVFIQTEVEPGSIAERLKSVLEITGNWYEDIYRILHYGDDKNDVAMREKERQYWDSLLDADFCVRGSTGFIVGDTIRVKFGPLVGKESKIESVDI